MLSPRLLRGGALGLAALATVWALVSASRMQVETDLVELLPASTPDFPGLAATAREMEPLDRIIVLLSLPDGPAPETDLLELGCRARDMLARSDLLGSVRCGWSPASEELLLRWVLPRSVLFYADDDARSELADLLAPDEAARRLDRLRREVAGVSGLLTSPLARADPLGLAPPAVASALQGTLTDSLVAGGGDSTLLFASVADTRDAAAAGRSLRRLLADTGAALAEETGLAIRLQGIGGPFYAAAYESSIRREVTLTVSVSAAAVALLLILSFGSLRLPLAVTAGVGAAVIWTAGLLAATRGHLSFIAVSMGAILIGLGVDYGIHVGRDMAVLRRAGTPAAEALGEAWRTHRLAIVSSAATTFVGFSVLALSDFRPLRELGLLIPLGIGLVLAGFAGVTVPLLAAAGSGRPPGDSPVRRAMERAAQAVAGAAAARPGRTLALLAGLTLLLAPGARQLRFESDFRLFRPPVPDLDRLEKTLRDDFALAPGLTRILVRAPELDAALDAGDRLTRLLARAGGDGAPPLAPTPWLLGERTLRQRQESLAGLITPALVQRLRDRFAAAGLEPGGFPEFFATLDAIASRRPLKPVPRPAWPDWLHELIHEQDGRATVSIVLAGDDPQVEERARQALAVFQPPADVQTVLFSLPRVGRAIQQALKVELRRLLGWAVLGVGLTLLLAFQGHAGRAALALAPAATAVLWLLGLCGWAGIPLNLFSVATFPVLVGIGIDDGLHVAHGAVREGSAATAARLRAGAMTMTTLTTMIGFGSLAFSSMPAVAAGGPVIAGGVGLCLLLTLALAPALEGALRRGGRP